MCKTLFFLSSLTVCSRLCFQKLSASLSVSDLKKNCKPSFYSVFFFFFAGRKSRIVHDLLAANRNRGCLPCFFGLGWSPTLEGPPNKSPPPDYAPPSPLSFCKFQDFAQATFLSSYLNHYHQYRFSQFATVSHPVHHESNDT